MQIDCMATNIIDYAYSEASKRSDGFAEAYAEEYASMGAAIEQGKFNGIFSSSGSGIRIRMLSLIMSIKLPIELQQC